METKEQILILVPHLEKCELHSCQAKFLSSSIECALRQHTSDVARMMHTLVGQEAWGTALDHLEMNYQHFGMTTQ